MQLLLGKQIRYADGEGGALQDRDVAANLTRVLVMFCYLVLRERTREGHGILLDLIEDTVDVRRDLLVAFLIRSAVYRTL